MNDLQLILKILIHDELIPAEVFKKAYSESTYNRLRKKVKEDKRYHKMFVKSGKYSYINKKMFEEYILTHDENLDTYNFKLNKFKEIGVVK